MTLILMFAGKTIHSIIRYLIEVNKGLLYLVVAKLIASLHVELKRGVSHLVSTVNLIALRLLFSTASLDISVTRPLLCIHIVA